MIPISIYDNLVPKELVSEIYNLLETGSFSPKELSFTNSPEYRSMVMGLGDIDNPSINKLMRIVYNILPDSNLYCLGRLYANATTMSDVPLPHRDSEFDNELTVIYYANPEWSITYGGETIFLNDDMNEIIRSVTPKAGRIVVFNSCTPHCARIHNRAGPNHRFTIAFKLLRKSRYGANKPV